MAEGSNFIVDAVVILGGAAFAAPLFKRIGLGTVLGYLSVGVMLGPILNYISDGEQILHVAELGVVLLLFIVGLELNPSRLWDMRRQIFGLGASQVILSGIVLTVLAWLAYFQLNAAIVVGFGLALSSTAFALQLLEDANEDRTPYGKKAFSILLFQDIAIAPLLVMVPLLAAGSMELTADGMSKIGIAALCLVGLIAAGRYALNPLFGVIATTGAREAMIAAALFVVIASAVLMQFAGLSMAMGAFVAGVMLAESSYRHQLEADIEPFRGILLGLFFVAVGLAVNLEIVWENLFHILWIVPSLLAIKAVILYLLCRLFDTSHNDSIRVAFVLPQHGEFAFVLFSAAMAFALLTPQEASFLIACVTLSMALTPISVKLGNLLIRHAADEDMEEDFEGAGAEVMMIGFSRLGQIAAQTLLAGGCDVTVLDNKVDRIRQAQRFGFRIYFGDGTRLDVLRAAGIEKAKIIAICTHDPEITSRIVDLVAEEYPTAKLYVRSYDRGHSIELLQRPGLWEIRETFESALVMGKALLEGIGVAEEEAKEIVADVRRRDSDRLKLQLQDGIMAGMDHLHTAPVPEPLVQPRHQGQAISSETKEVLGNE